MNYLMYNASANNGRAKDRIEAIKAELSNQNVKEYDLLSFSSYTEIIKNLKVNDKLYLVGGDGTLNHFINDVEDANIPAEVCYYASGTGNDFLHDLDVEDASKAVKINQYIEHLPVATIKGKKYKFINGIGFGIDGYCCEEGDRLRRKNKKKINYTAIAIKGLLMKFKPRKATIVIDGFTKTYNKVWLAPTMLGRYYGGGMKITPNQFRDDKRRVVSLAVLHDIGKLKTLMRFPSIFAGEHIKYKEMIDIFQGHEVKVVFDKPCALQVDGETILDVKEYTVSYN